MADVWLVIVLLWVKMLVSYDIFSLCVHPFISRVDNCCAVQGDRSQRSHRASGGAIGFADPVYFNSRNHRGGFRSTGKARGTFWVFLYFCYISIKSKDFSAICWGFLSMSLYFCLSCLGFLSMKIRSPCFVLLLSLLTFFREATRVLLFLGGIFRLFRELFEIRKHPSLVDLSRVFILYDIACHPACSGPVCFRAICSFGGESCPTSFLNNEIHVTVRLWGFCLYPSGGATS